MTALEIINAFFSDFSQELGVTEADLWRACPDKELLGLAVHLSVCECFVVQNEWKDRSDTTKEQIAEEATRRVNERLNAERERRHHARDGMADSDTRGCAYTVQMLKSCIKLLRVQEKEAELSSREASATPTPETATSTPAP